MTRHRTLAACALLATALAACGGDNKDNVVGPTTTARGRITTVEVGVPRNSFYFLDGTQPVPVAVHFSVSPPTQPVTLYACLSESGDPKAGSQQGVTTWCEWLYEAASPATFDWNDQPVTWAGSTPSSPRHFQYVHAYLHEGFIVPGVTAYYTPLATRSVRWPISLQSLTRCSVSPVPPCAPR